MRTGSIASAGRQRARGRRRSKAEVGRQADRHTRTGRDQRHPRQRRPWRTKSSFETASTIAMPTPSGTQLRDALADRLGATRHGDMVDQSHLAPRLRLQHTRQIAVIGVSGWFCMPLSLSSTSPANR